MKTIAVTIDEPTLRRIERLLAVKNPGWRNRSEVFRQAVYEFVARREKEMEEAREKEIFRRFKRRLNQQTKFLIRTQASL
ncbi:MAG: hypothetical protein M1421_03980 [Candidatus Eremiobacteraeota bacterium]|nr:hypothetical protein [Candidatus Eremiobacteraeota bacterium]